MPSEQRKQEIVAEIQKLTAKFYAGGGDGLTVGPVEHFMFEPFLNNDEYMAAIQGGNTGMWEGYGDLICLLTVEQWEEVLRNFTAFYEDQLTEWKKWG